jgi:hypothetical protein
MSLLDEIRRFPDSFQFVRSNVEKNVKSILPSTKQYIFDENASRYMANFVKNNGDLIINNEQFAIPHFENVYYEFNIDAFLDELGRPISSGVDEEKDGTLGYLISGNAVYLISKGLGERAKPSVLHYGYSIGRTPLYKPVIQPLLSRRQKATFFLGSTMELATISQFQDIAEKYEILNFTDGIDNDMLLKTILGNATGDIRNMIMMILFLYQSKDVITVNEIAPSRGFMKGKAMTYMAYGSVKINLRNSTGIRKNFIFPSGTHASPRRHSVNSYYRTVPKNNGCEHDFELVNENRWVCKKCKAKRALIKQYERGDATIGYKLKTYDVTAR